MKIMIGITGFSGAGKTDLSTCIGKKFPENILVISQDNYYFGCDPAQAEVYNFDQIAALDIDKLYRDLVSLRNNEQIELPIYNFKLHRRTGYRQICPESIILLEGHLVFLEEKIRDLFDLLAFVYVDPYLALLRRIRRDVISRERDVTQILNRYEQFVASTNKEIEKLIDFSDIVIPYYKRNEKAMEVLLAFIAFRLQNNKNV